MTWTWDQSAGTLSRDGKLISRRYSGKARGKNNLALEGVMGVGPFPAWRWTIGEPYESDRVGPSTLWLPRDARSLAVFAPRAEGGTIYEGGKRREIHDLGP